ncbi:MAG: glycosyltransferase family 2 protein, partial [Proteiniphilum sp.]|nr:glycosyltransferase family 2 protein [Proteiniphilum sp.]
MQKINAFILFTQPEQAVKTVEGLRQSELIQSIYLLTPDETAATLEGCEKIVIDRLQSTDTIRKIASKSTAGYALIYQKPSVLKTGYFALERMVRIACDAQAGMAYADYYAIAGGEKKNHPVIDYQEGSLRDDFNFGSLLLYHTGVLKEAVTRMNDDYRFAGLYDLRLKVSQRRPLVHINEYLYTEIEEDGRASGEKIFDYVDPKNRQVQIEMEQACTQHLKEIGAYLAPQFEEIELNKNHFEYEASVIIPVRNRVKTIKDAIASVLKQKTGFPFNLIVADNHSTDGTTEAIAEFKNDRRLIHIIPERDDLYIGGCWNLCVHHP